MSIERIIMAWLASFVAGLALAFLWHAVLMDNYFTEQYRQITRDQYVDWAFILAYALVTLFMSYLFPHGYKGGSAVAEGLRFGIVMGLIWMLPSSLILYGFAKVPLEAVLVDSAWHLFEGAILGIIIGVIYSSSRFFRKIRKKEA